jgi:hypothetical protein
MTSAREAPGFSPWSGPSQALLVLAACLLSRLATSIHYIEDPDSLRFALALVDYDVARLQPQFPGYPAFCFFAKVLSLLLGGYGLGFAALGGIGLFALLHYGLALARWRLLEPRGLALAGLVFFNPMLWLLGNRYMSDLSGAALALAAFYHLSRGDSRRHVAAGFFLGGMLAGWRLSYVPFLVLPMVLALADRGRPGFGSRWMERIAAAAAGTAAWLIPFIFVTGFKTLIDTARFQTAGHFEDFGGTYRTEPEWGLRALRLAGRLWTDGLGAWEPGRHGATAVVAIGAAVLLALARPRTRAALSRPAVRLLLAAWLGYALWIFFFQNVVHQSRHVLPLVTPLLLALAGGLPRTFREARERGKIRSAVFVLFLGAYAFVGTSLALQHRRPAAIAQAKTHVETFAEPGLTVVAAPWVAKCLSAQGVKARYLVVETPAELAALRRLNPALPLATVGDYSDHLDRPVLERRAFYHNPYVNRLGARVEVFRYGSRTESRE